MEFILSGWFLIGMPSACILVAVVLRRAVFGGHDWGIEMQGKNCGRGVNLYGYDSKGEAEQAARDFAHKVNGS